MTLSLDAGVPAIRSLPPAVRRTPPAVSYVLIRAIREPGARLARGDAPATEPQAHVMFELRVLGESVEHRARGEAPCAIPALSEAVRRAAGYISVNGHEPICTGDIARASGISVRTLYRSFVREYGTTPMQYLKRWRMDRVRVELLSAGPGTTVTRVAFEYGVTHLGRFAQEYSRAFGEAPSGTLCHTLSARAPVNGRMALGRRVPGERRGMMRNEDGGAGPGRLGPQGRQRPRMLGVHG